MNVFIFAVQVNIEFNNVCLVIVQILTKLNPSCQSGIFPFFYLGIRSLLFYMPLRYLRFYAG